LPFDLWNEGDFISQVEGQRHSTQIVSCDTSSPDLCEEKANYLLLALFLERNPSLWRERQTASRPYKSWRLMEVTMDTILGLIAILVFVVLLAYSVSVLRYAASTEYKTQRALRQRWGGM